MCRILEIKDSDTAGRTITCFPSHNSIDPRSSSHSSQTLPQQDNSYVANNTDVPHV